MLRLSLLGVMVLTGVALGQGAASRPGGVGFEAGSPQGVVEALTKAMSAGDGGAIRSILYATNESERKMVDAMVAMSESIARLRPVAEKRYGVEAAKNVTGDAAASAAEQHAKLESAYVQVAGDVAHVTFPDATVDPITLKRVGGKWRVPVGEHAPKLSPEEMERRAGDLTAAARVVDEVTGLCQGGKWQTPNDVVIAIQERILKAQQARLPAATQPSMTTAPATRPDP